jgi:hypothetical protein
MRPGQDIVVTTSTGKSFTCTHRFDTEVNEVFTSDNFGVGDAPVDLYIPYKLLCFFQSG